jgi:hypothetical protein
MGIGGWDLIVSLANHTRPAMFQVPTKTVILGIGFENMDVRVFRKSKMDFSETDDSLPVVKTYGTHC